MSLWSDQFLDAHFHDSQRLLEKHRLTRRDMDEWEINLKLHHPSRIGLGSLPFALIIQLREYFTGLHANQPQNIVKNHR